MTLRHTHWSAFSMTMAALLLVLTSCGGSSDESDTSAPSASTSETTLAMSEPWDLVWLSDSMGSRVADAWADLIESNEGVTVEVHNYAIGLQPIEAVRDSIFEDASIREQVADAEIIVVYGNPAKTAPRDMALSCLDTSGTTRDPPQLHTSASFKPFGDVYREIFDEIFELRAGQPTVIRTFDQFSGMLAGWREAGIEQECTAGWEATAEAISEAADEYGVLVASFYDEFNGTLHDEDAYEKGYIRADRRHASPEGALVQAKVIHALGYEPIVP